MPSTPIARFLLAEASKLLSPYGLFVAFTRVLLALAVASAIVDGVIPRAIVVMRVMCQRCTDPVLHTAMGVAGDGRSKKQAASLHDRMMEARARQQADSNTMGAQRRNIRRPPRRPLA
jgi:hypothetical protein